MRNSLTMAVALGAVLAVSAGALATLGSGRADADERYPPVTDEMTRKECGDCHMAFQPAFLPARSWEKIMDNLGNHFGEDASLPPEKVEHIKKYLMENAADRRWRSKMMRGVRPDWTPLRITELPYWKYEHEKEVPPAAWKDPKVGSKANCKACHRYADRGIYEAEEYEYGYGYGRYGNRRGYDDDDDRYEYGEYGRRFGKRGYYRDDD
jgi:hypothetical protein